MRSATIAFAAVFAAGLVALLVVGLSQGSTLVYSPGANPTGTAVTLKPGQEACQSPLLVPDGAAFDRVEVTLGTFGRPGPPIAVEVEGESGRRLAGGRLEGGYPDVAQTPRHSIDVGRVQTSEPIGVCFENEGTRQVAIFGQVGIAAPASGTTVDGTAVDADLAISLNRERRSLPALLPEMADRAARFRAGWVSPLVYLGLLVGVVVLAPLLLARGLGRAAREP